MHAIRVELIVTYVMASVVPTTPEHPFHTWFRFEWGTNGNPHAHGKLYCASNPTFDCIVDTDETRRELLAHGHSEALKLRTKDGAQSELGDFFDPLVCEQHPCKTETGDALFPFVQELLSQPDLAQPQCTDLLDWWRQGYFVHSAKKLEKCSI